MQYRSTNTRCQSIALREDDSGVGVRAIFFAFYKATSGIWHYLAHIKTSS